MWRTGENLSPREGVLLGRYICFKVYSAVVFSDILEIRWPAALVQPSTFPSDIYSSRPSKGGSRMVAGEQEPWKSVDYSLTFNTETTAGLNLD